jgi:hypothetical protein
MEVSSDDDAMLITRGFDGQSNIEMGEVQRQTQRGEDGNSEDDRQSERVTREGYASRAGAGYGAARGLPSANARESEGM